jgi:hypothetical protein
LVYFECFFLNFNFLKAGLDLHENIQVFEDSFGTTQNGIEIDSATPPSQKEKPKTKPKLKGSQNILLMLRLFIFI